ncbi:hypothetical protein PG984_006680 [Apiospora sp. TS-2023a]
MNSTICAQCRQALGQRLRASSSLFTQSASRTHYIVSATTGRPLAQRRQNHTNSQSTNNDSDPDIRSLLSNPTCRDHQRQRDHQQNPAPPPAALGAAAPATPEEEDALLTTLRTQLHFVRSIQGVDTAGVAPLAAIRDEAARGRREQTIGLEALKEALANEDVVGHSRRPRRRRVEQEQQKKEGQRNEAEDWDALAGASETAGRYFVVRSGKGGEAQ